MKTTKRPRWAKSLPNNLWKHLQGGQAKKNPTLRSLKIDALGPCQDCRRALEIASGLSGSK